MNIDGIKASFNALPERERRALVILAVFVAAAIVVQAIWTMQEATAGLRQQLPVLENKVALVRSAERSVQDYRAKPPLRTYEGDALMQRALELARPRIPGLQAGAMTLDGNRGLSFQTSVPFDAWIEFVAAAHRELALRVVSCEVGQGGAGLVQVRARFALADPMP